MRQKIIARVCIWFLILNFPSIVKNNRRCFKLYRVIKPLMFSTPKNKTPIRTYFHKYHLNESKSCVIVIKAPCLTPHCHISVDVLYCYCLIFVFIPPSYSSFSCYGNFTNQANATSGKRDIEYNSTFPLFNDLCLFARSFFSSDGIRFKI